MLEDIGKVPCSEPGRLTKLEICVDNIESAIAAYEGGADRLELCGALDLGGITPSIGFVQTFMNLALSIPYFMIIRPRAGDFTYSHMEVENMIWDIKSGLKFGAAGFVTGAICNKQVDKEVCRKLIAAAKGRPVTFHRAFDLIEQQGAYNALEDIKELGFKRILTSGCKQNAYEGRHKLRSLVTEAGSDIIIMPGCGINPENILEIAQFTGATEFHSSGQLRHEDIVEEDLIIKGSKKYPKTDSEVVLKMRTILNSYESKLI